MKYVNLVEDCVEGCCGEYVPVHQRSMLIWSKNEIPPTGGQVCTESTITAEVWVSTSTARRQATCAHYVQILTIIYSCQSRMQTWKKRWLAILIEGRWPTWSTVTKEEDWISIRYGEHTHTTRMSEIEKSTSFEGLSMDKRVRKSLSGSDTTSRIQRQTLV